MPSIIFDPKSTKFSLKNAYLLVLCSELVYSDKSTVETTMAGYGFNCTFDQDQRDFFDTQFFVAHNDDNIIIAFRGTEPTSLIDWITDAQFFLTDFNDKNGNPIGSVHSGFYKAADYIWEKLMKLLLPIPKNNQQLWITGHSLGGALATVVACRFLFETENARPISGIYTYGQPRVFDEKLGLTFNTAIGSRFFRFVNNNDIVTCVPPAPPITIPRVNCYFPDVGKLCFFDSDGNLHDNLNWLDSIYAEIGTLKRLEITPAFISNHYIKNYVSNVKAALEGRVSVDPALS